MIILICGHSRAGKTTYSKRYDNECKVIHLDDTHSYQMVKEQVEKISDDVVVEGIYYSKDERKGLLDAYKGEGAICIFIDTPFEVRQSRVTYKLRDNYPFPMPTLSEGWDEIAIVHGDIVEFICRENSDYTMLPYK